MVDGKNVLISHIGICRFTIRAQEGWTAAVGLPGRLPDMTTRCLTRSGCRRASWSTDVVQAEMPTTSIWVDLGDPQFVEQRGEGVSLAGRQHELGLVDRAWAPPGAAAGPDGAIMYWHVDDIAVTFQKLLSMGAKEYQPITPRGDQGFVTAAVTDPFGNVLGIMHNPHYLQMLRTGGPA